MQLILFDDHSWDNLLPLTFTRPAAALRVGVLTIAEKWESALDMPPSFMTRKHLSRKFPMHQGDQNLWINGTLLPDENLVRSIRSLQSGESLKKGDTLLAAATGPVSGPFEPDHFAGSGMEYPGDPSQVDYPWKVFGLNGREIEADMHRLTAGRSSHPLNDTVRVIHPENVFVEEGFTGEHFTLNASTGPIYLGKGSEIMEGSVIRGPFSLCEGALVKMGTRIYGPTTIGPWSKVAGEINDSVIQAHSNKAHDGYLGNAVIGEWCNLGADTNNSNLKNNYSEVKIWNYPKNRFISTGLQLCGLFMGDHSKCGINTMFNTGTVVGVSANIFGDGFPRNFIPSFSWGGAGGFTNYRIDKALETADLVLGRRGLSLSDADREILHYVYDFSERFRKWK
jgi:UDP-N-acetylglucosamine diphosphorylase/glucosamine-1-phosphate N-acetyltransferase